MCIVLRNKKLVSALRLEFNLQINFAIVSTCYKHFSGIIDEAKIKNYTSYRSELVTKCKSAIFQNAVQQLEEYMSDRVVSEGYNLKVI